MIKNIKIKKTGFTLLLSMILASVALIVGLGVFFIILKEIQISGVGRESQIAFHAADSGAECVIYWDAKKNLVSTTTVNQIECAEQTVNVGGASVSSFVLNLVGNNSCVEVTIDKMNPALTVIESRGYNVGCSSVSPRKVERAIRVTY
jgi:Tfp pilus assembly protein PilX